MIVVSNTTPLSELAKVEQMHLLRDVFGEVIIPQEVYDELTRGIHPAATAVRSATWISVYSVNEDEKISQLQADTGLDLGEAAAIILAEELGADHLLMDERAGRRVAKLRNLSVIGMVGTLLLAKQQGLIPNVKDILDDLLAQGTRISLRLYQYALTTAQE